MNNKYYNKNRHSGRKEGEFHHKKSLGQNFIMDEALLEQLVSLSGVEENDIVLEIGTGAGTLTEQLAKHCKKVITVQIDDTLIPILNVTLGKYDNVELIHENILKTDIRALIGEQSSVRVVANIPYYITTDIIIKLLKEDHGFKSVSMMVQKEAADRICAKPGCAEYGMLSVRCAWRGTAQKVLQVPASAFIPPPKVDSTFVHISMCENAYRDRVDEKLFMKVAETAFLMRRKTFANNLCGVFHLEKEEAAALLEGCGLERNIRGEELNISEFALVAEKLQTIMKDRSHT